MPKITISVIKADVGSFPGHSRTHPKLLEKAHKMLKEQEGKLLTDSFVTHCGDDLELIMTHTLGEGNEKIHHLAADVFTECSRLARQMKLHGVGQETIDGGFFGSISGIVPGSAEMEFEERKSEPVLVFMADKANAGAWNFFLCKSFADPFSTPGLITDLSMQKGFTFEVHDLRTKCRIRFSCPEESYQLLAYAGDSSRYIIRRVFTHDGEIVAVTSTRPQTAATGNTGDPVMIVRTQHGFPSVGEVLEPFCTLVLVPGLMRDSHGGPLMPVGLCDANATRNDGPPRVICLGFQVCNGGLVGPADLFDDIAFDRIRSRCSELADIIRAQGPFVSHRCNPEESQHTAIPAGKELLTGRWEPLPPGNIPD